MSAAVSAPPAATTKEATAPTAEALDAARVKLIIFDLDGVLMDSRELHYQALNRALEAVDAKYVITREMHENEYDGRPTNAKLKMLTEQLGLPASLHQKIWDLKQEKTFEVINDTFRPDERLRTVLRELKARGFKLYCASNSIYKTLMLMLLRTGLLEYFDFILSCEDVLRAKPAPDIYIQCCLRASVSTKQAIILEDSPVGQKAASGSGCNLLPVLNPDTVTLDYILKKTEAVLARNLADM